MTYVNRNKTYTHILKYAGSVQGLAILVGTVRHKLVAPPLGVVGIGQCLSCRICGCQCERRGKLPICGHI